MKISDICFLKTELNQPQNSKTENSVSVVQFSNKKLSYRLETGRQRRISL